MDIISLIVNIVTAISTVAGAILIIRQLRQNQKISAANHLDNLYKDYRMIDKDYPIDINMYEININEYKSRVMHRIDFLM